MPPSKGMVAPARPSPSRVLSRRPLGPARSSTSSRLHLRGHQLGPGTDPSGLVKAATGSAKGVRSVFYVDPTGRRSTSDRSSMESPRVVTMHPCGGLRRAHGSSRRSRALGYVEPTGRHDASVWWATESPRVVTMHPCGGLWRAHRSSRCIREVGYGEPTGRLDASHRSSLSTIPPVTIEEPRSPRRQAPRGHFGRGRGWRRRLGWLGLAQEVASAS
jgi:hypothetical protein